MVDKTNVVCTPLQGAATWRIYGMIPEPLAVNSEKFNDDSCHITVF